jgi:hypothetical protein
MKTKRDSDGPPARAMVRLVFGVIFAGAVTAHTQPALSVANAPGFPGSTVSLPVSLRRATNVTALQFDVAYNPAKVTAGALVPGALFSNHVVRTREVAPGVHRVLAFSRVNAAVTVTNSAAAATLPFTVSPREYVSSGPIMPSNVVLARPDATAVVPVTLNSGTIFVRPVNLLPSGEAQFFLPSEPDTRYLIQATTDFVTWVNLTNTTATANFMDLVDADAGRYPYRFYRWVLYDAAGEIGAVTQLPGGGLSFQFRGLAGRTYVVQASSDLQRWTDVRTNVATIGTLNFTNLIDAAFPHRFFRLKSE